MTGSIEKENYPEGISVAVKKPFLEALLRAHEEKRRLVAPLVGFPGLTLAGTSVKLAQQNYGEHFKVLKAIADTFHPDALFPLMDLSVEANAIGRYTVFPKDESATVVKDEFRRQDLAAAAQVDISFDTRLLGYVETIKMMSTGLPPAVLRGAYVTGPYTLAALLMGADDAATATVTRPEMLHEICSFATGKIQQYVRLMIAAGAQLVCILEPSAVMLGPDQFREFSAAYVRRICEGCKRTAVSTVYHVCGNSMHLVEAMSSSGVDALSLDSAEAGVDLPVVAQRIPEHIVLVGNLSPTGSILCGQPDDVEKDVIHLLREMEGCSYFVLSTGCDLPQETPVENIRAFMRAGRNYVVG